MISCQVKRPDIVLSDAEMEHVLYDYHLAKAMADGLSYNEFYKKALYQEAVFQKYGITQAQFDSSLVWFSRNPEVLTKIYEKVNLRLKAERDNINHLIALREKKTKGSQPGDSIDIWAWRRIYRLMSTPLDNKITFSFPADTNFYDRDTLRWVARYQMTGPLTDTIHRPVMFMQIIYQHDTLGLMKFIRESGQDSLELNADTLGAIREVNGFIYLPGCDEPRTLLVDRIRLMRYHAHDSLPQVAPVKPEVTTGHSDTLPRPAVAADSAKQGRPVRSVIRQSRPKPTFNQKRTSTSSSTSPVRLKRQNQ